jgi:hypothetical protein
MPDGVDNVVCFMIPNRPTSMALAAPVVLGAARELESPTAPFAPTMGFVVSTPT